MRGSSITYDSNTEVADPTAALAARESLALPTFLHAPTAATGIVAAAAATPVTAPGEIATASSDPRPIGTGYAAFRR